MDDPLHRYWNDFKAGMKPGLEHLNQFPPRVTGAKLVYAVAFIYLTSALSASLRENLELLKR